nr:hypothetical protein CFP56_49219 [Quercus suber]
MIHSLSKNVTKGGPERTGTRFLTSLTSDWAGCMCKETVNPGLIQSLMMINTINQKSVTKMMLGLARLSVWWMNKWKWTMIRVRRSVK